ncbi:heme exporter protein CcmD [Simiduia sp. 21SJ11W-1]|uniref:heme exporter protein CcmD n=1 Tax=Simiduia sp. 21SJ11W-1 TaxID=2909669 RepID=UPI00209EC966|nr:heme exporter protein CcmD [Simiduia sp. 21SJ11W-1]UTA46524.1 heme exporter protein CcmD [Simiduia sp. 21SJ11W-1]
MTFQFDSLQAFFYMQGHGVFVWSVMAISLVVFAGLVIWPLRAHRQALAEQQRLARIDEARRQPPADPKI